MIYLIHQHLFQTKKITTKVIQIATINKIKKIQHILTNKDQIKQAKTNLTNHYDIILTGYFTKEDNHDGNSSNSNNSTTNNISTVNKKRLLLL